MKNLERFIWALSIFQIVLFCIAVETFAETNGAKGILGLVLNPLCLVINYFSIQNCRR